MLSDHTLSILIFAGIDVIMALSFYLPASAGQLSAGQGGFMALGAYTAAYLTVQHGAPFPLALGANALARMAMRADELLIKMLPGLFSYQIFMVVAPMPTVDALLDNSIDEGTKRAGELAAAGAVPTR